jgi:hypothetical protein
MFNREKPEQSSPKFQTDHIPLGTPPPNMPGQQMLPSKRCGQGGKTVEYSRGTGCHLAPVNPTVTFHKESCTLSKYVHKKIAACDGHTETKEVCVCVHACMHAEVKRI